VVYSKLYATIAARAPFVLMTIGHILFNESVRRAPKDIVKIKTICLGMLLLTSFCHPALGQSYKASIRGTITDNSRLRLANVATELIEIDTNEKRTAITGEQGDFTISLLPPGTYRLEVQHKGYKKYVQQLTVAVNQEIRLDISLEIGSIAEVLIVTAPDPQLRRDSSAIGAVVENSQVTRLPLDGRNFLELSLLVPGAAPAAQGSASSVRGDFAFNVNGAREDSNSFLLDGVYNIDPKLNSVGVNPPVDAIREFELLTSSYDASFGRNAGGQVNIVLKSGSNSLHGAAYEFFRNGVLDARNFFAPAGEKAPKYQRNQFGLALGGPVIKNRTFFFVDYEGTRVREGITHVTNVPTLAERRGDFSQSLFAPPINPFTQQPFPGNKIPDLFINPIGKAIAALYPAPNRNVPFVNFVSSPTLRDRNDHFDVRLDHALSKSSELAARYSFADRDLFEPFTGPGFPAVPGFGDNVPRRAQNLMLSETHIFSSALVNEARFAFSRVAAAVLQENSGTSINNQVGLPELSTNPRDFGLSFITVSGFSPLGDEYNNPQQSVTNMFQALDGASYARGKHLLKFGFDFRAIQQNAFRDVQSRGFLTFSSQVPITGNALADLLLGLPALTGGARLDNHQHLRTESYGFYVNDSFRIRPNLTLSGGLRYEYNSPPVDAFDRANLYDPATGSLVPVGTNGIPRSGYAPDKNNWAPRVGLAWTLGSKGNTVLRAGYGVYYDQSSLAPSEGLYFNAPFFDFNLFFSVPGLPLTLNNPFPSFFPVPLPHSAFAFQRDLRTPYMQQWNVSWQQALGKSRIVEVAYVGSKGTKLITARDINQPRPSPAQFNPRPVLQFDDITFEESSANSNYNSLQVRFQQRLDFGLSILSSYTWSKSIDNASNFFSSAGDPNFPQDSFNTAAERGRSNFDVRHRFSLSYGYDFPCGKSRTFIANSGLLSTLLAGWQTFGILSLQSGRPFTVALLPEIDNSNTGRSTLGFGANDRPNIVGSAELSHRTPDRWFNTSAFAFPPFGSFGNAGRNILDGPGFANFNASVLKTTKLREGLNLQIRAEAFNVFNHPNFDLPDNFVGSPTFGQILSAQSPRHIQFGLKLLF
jgi:Carboxypeptidase regulatory-like domain/TonB dependent receptor